MSPAAARMHDGSIIVSASRKRSRSASAARESRSATARAPCPPSLRDSGRSRRSSRAHHHPRPHLRPRYRAPHPARHASHHCTDQAQRPSTGDPPGNPAPAATPRPCRCTPPRCAQEQPRKRAGVGSPRRFAGLHATSESTTMSARRGTPPRPVERGQQPCRGGDGQESVDQHIDGARSPIDLPCGR